MSFWLLLQHPKKLTNSLPIFKKLWHTLYYTIPPNMIKRRPLKLTRTSYLTQTFGVLIATSDLSRPNVMRLSAFSMAYWWDIRTALSLSSTDSNQSIVFVSHSEVTDLTLSLVESLSSVLHRNIHCVVTKKAPITFKHRLQNPQKVNC